MSDRPTDIDEIRGLCAERHPHSSDEDIAWLAVHRLLKVDAQQAEAASLNDVDFDMTPWAGQEIHEAWTTGGLGDAVLAAIIDNLRKAKTS